ncbi:RING finger protein unkempt -like protein [Takifugu flavidus]|uniref:RING finger protein unkempt-like protein n=1 Tax=Takifugu flavidus TaxID=433684 RepID=A0A5C6PTD2_9TELE|nr:RING finger protein unkempt -like protein [Takifugu flavidus]
MSKAHSQLPSCSAATTTRGPSSSSSSSPAGGSTSPATVLNVQPEKPQHYTYLKEFRTEQCPLFVQHKCTQHRPFSCFHWHFLNQRRRRPIRRRDGTFNYSPDIYCTKYDEGTGTCPDGDECPFLHRTAGDTERRYHLRYYKTGSCIHETDAKGHCSKNGSHCAFAHGSHDLRSPVYDIREVQVMESQGGAGATEGDGQSGQAASTALIEKILSEEPRWQDHNYVLSHYKTELCKKPPRLCRQGYACPYYHNSKDRRRSPHKHKYSLAATPPSPAPLGTPGSGISSGMNINALPFYPTSETVESVVESALDDLDLNDFGVSALERSLESSSNLSNVGVMLGQGSPGTPPTLLASGLCAESSRLKQELEEAQRALKQWGHSWRHTAQSWAALKADAEESRAHAARLAMEAERARQAEEEAQRKASLLQEALESLRSGDNPHLALHQLQLLHRLPLESILSLQAQLCSCLQAVEQVVYRKQRRQCCVTCGEQGSVSLPCGHGLQCDSCSTATECPLCSEQTLEQPLS